MSADQNDPLGEPIPMASADDSDDGASKIEPISLEPLGTQNDTDGGNITPSSKIRTFESTSTLKKDLSAELKRPLNITGKGATRVRTFHTKLNDGAFAFLDGQINEWIDSNEQIEVKFCNTTIGVVEAKRSEPHVIMTVWY